MTQEESSELKLVPNCPYVLIGKVGSGKTMLARYIYETLKLGECQIKWLFTSSCIENWSDLHPIEKITTQDELILSLEAILLTLICRKEMGNAYVIIDGVIINENKQIKHFLELLFQVCREWQITIIICIESAVNVFTDTAKQLSNPILFTDDEIENWNIKLKHFETIKEYFGNYTGVCRDEKYIRRKSNIIFVQ